MQNTYKKVALFSALALSGINAATAQTLSAGGNNSLYICANGKPMAWGYNTGQFGNGASGAIVMSPVYSNFGPTDIITDVASGNQFSVFLKSDKTVWTSGANNFGQAGTAATNISPTQVPGVTDVSAIGVGFYHTFFIKTDGTVWACGRNDKGQLGDGNITGIDPNPTPVQVSISNVTKATGGFFHSLFLKSDGTVWGCGQNNDGQLGFNNPNQVSTPVQIPGLSNIVDIKAGQYFSMFLKGDGTVWVCGDNDYGQLADGTVVDKTSPIQVPGLTGITDIATGETFSLFLKSDGTIWGAGENSKGELGNGNTDQTNSPTQVTGLTNVADMAAGYGHSVFRKSDNTVWAVGYNLLGQLGDGTNVDKLAPVQVTALCQGTNSGSEEITSSSFSIYPNPSGGLVHFFLNNNLNSEKTEVTVFNSKGQNVYSKANLNSQYSINLNHLAKGLYYLQATNGTESFTQKIVLE